MAEAPTPLFGDQPQPPDPPQRPKVEAEFVRALLGVAWNICSARLLALLAVIGAIAMFSYAGYEPMPWRVYSAAGYSIAVLWPLVWLYAKRG